MEVTLSEKQHGGGSRTLRFVTDCLCFCVLSMLYEKVPAERLRQHKLSARFGNFEMTFQAIEADVRLIACHVDTDDVMLVGNLNNSVESNHIKPGEDIAAQICIHSFVAHIVSIKLKDGKNSALCLV